MMLKLIEALMIIGFSFLVVIIYVAFDLTVSDEQNQFNKKTEITQKVEKMLEVFSLKKIESENNLGTLEWVNERKVVLIKQLGIFVICVLTIIVLLFIKITIRRYKTNKLKKGLANELKIGGWAEQASL